MLGTTERFSPMLVYLAVFASALCATWLLTPLARKLALRNGIVDKPDVRKQHRDPVPYLGGIAVFGGLLVGLTMLLLFARDPAKSFERLDTKVLAMVLGACAMFLTGLVDDTRHLRARHKLLIQLLVASSMWLCGIRIEGITLSETLVLDFGVFSFPITVLWIAGVTNAINFIDGLDGLAAGIGAISAAAIGFVAFSAGQYPTAALLAILTGSLLGFLPHNRHPARIFLGDSGSLLIGFLLATAAVTTNSKSAAFVSVAAPFLALGVPILDMCFAVARRWIERRGLFSSDRNHIHHRLLALGYSHARTVQILWAESAVTTVLALVLLYGGAETWQRLIGFSLVFAGHVWFFRVTGAVRLRDSYWAFQRAAQRLRLSNLHQQCYDELDLHFRAVRCIDDWWRAVQLCGERLQFTSVRLRLVLSDEGSSERTWRNRHPAPGAMLRASFPLAMAGEWAGAQLDVELPARSIEGSGQLLEVFGRLLDRHGLDAAASDAPALAVGTHTWKNAVG